jgi:hypothetical protein
MHKLTIPRPTLGAHAELEQVVQAIHVALPLIINSRAERERRRREGLLPVPFAKATPGHQK